MFKNWRTAVATLNNLQKRMRIVIQAGLIAILFANPPAYADSAAQVTKLLDTGWKASQDNFAAAEEQYVQAKREAPSDVRVPYAMALVAIKNQHAEQASKYLAEALSNGKPLLPIRRTKIWQAISRGDAVTGQTAISELGLVLSADDSLQNKADYRETARWLGGIVEFCLEPGNTRFKSDEVSSIDAELTSTLKGTLATEYAAGKEAVTNRYSELQAQLAATRKEVVQNSGAQLAENQAQIDTALANTITERQAAAQLAEQLQEKLVAEAPVLQARGRELSRQWDETGQRLKNLQDQLKREQSKQYKDQNQTLVQSLNFDIKLEEQRVKERKQPLEKEISEIRARLKANQSKFLAAQQDVQRLVRLEQLRSVKSKQLARQDANASSGRDPKIAALGQQLTSITTYVSFSLDQEKRLILATFATK